MGAGVLARATVAFLLCSLCAVFIAQNAWSGMARKGGPSGEPGERSAKMARYLLDEAERFGLDDERYKALEKIVSAYGAEIEKLSAEKADTRRALKRLLAGQKLDKAGAEQKSEALAEVQAKLSRARTGMMLKIREEVGQEFVARLESVKPRRGGYGDDYRRGYRGDNRDEYRMEERRHRWGSRKRGYRGGEHCEDCGAHLYDHKPRHRGRYRCGCDGDNDDYRHERGECDCPKPRRGCDCY